LPSISSPDIAPPSQLEASFLKTEPAVAGYIHIAD
jgi:hypothetical protein